MTAPGPLRVLRFTVAERAAHWAFALPLLAALGSGVVLSWGDRLGLQPDHFVLRRFHIIAGAGVVVAPLAVALSTLFSGGRERFRAVIGTLSGTRPTGQTESSGRPIPEFGAGQQVFAAFVASAAVLELASGVELWQWDRFGLGARAAAAALHQGLALGLVPVVLGHVYLAALHPTTRWTLPGMVTGRVVMPTVRDRSHSRATTAGSEEEQADDAGGADEQRRNEEDSDVDRTTVGPGQDQELVGGG